MNYVTEKGQAKSEDFDLVVLSQGLEMHPDDGRGLCRRLGVELNQSQFAATDSFAPVATSRKASTFAAPWPAPRTSPCR